MYEDSDSSLFSPTFVSMWLLILAILVRVKWFPIGLICISLVTNDVEHHFMCLLVICIFLGEMSIVIPCPFLIAYFFIIIEDYFCVNILKILWISGEARSSGSTILPETFFFMYLISAFHNIGFL